MEALAEGGVTSVLKNCCNLLHYALGGVLNEVVGLLPIALPVIIGFIGLRKGISFITNTFASSA